MIKPIHILIISQCFYPEAFRINDIAIEWVKRGYRVSVLTGIPNYPQGRFYKGYGYNKRRHETWNGIDITRIPLIPRGNSLIGLVANYLSFMLSGMIWASLHKTEADLVFSFETSPMTQVMVGCIVKKKYKIPHFLYVQDLWPENVETVTGIHLPIVIKPINKMVDYIYRHSDRIFATSPSFVESITNRKVKVPSEKVYYWPQYAEDFYRPIDRKQVYKEANENSMVNIIPHDDRFKIIFTGNIGVAQGLDILSNAAEVIKQDKREQKRDVLFVIVGDGRYREKLMENIRKQNVEDMFLHIPRQPATEIPKLISCCDATFVSFMDNELFRRTIPAKLQSYMACGKPVIAAVGGESRLIIEEANCGLCCDTGDKNGLADAIKAALNLSVDELHHMGENARCYFMKHFEKQSLLDIMSRWVLEEIQGKTRVGERQQQ